MKIFYDTEFLELGPEYPIELISIGMVREDGKQLYFVNSGFDPNKFLRHTWLLKNVVPWLPVKKGSPGSIVWDVQDQTVLGSRAEIRNAVRRFVLEVENPELWAWFASYDHVVLAQIFGTMAELPSTFPMWTNDFMQVIQHKNFNVTRNNNAHNALSDALWLKEQYERYESLG